MGVDNVLNHVLLTLLSASADWPAVTKWHGINTLSKSDTDLVATQQLAIITDLEWAIPGNSFGFLV
jgi:hypothetical protein